MQHPTHAFSSDLLGPEGAALFSWSPTGDLLAAAGFRVRTVADARVGICPCKVQFNILFPLQRKKVVIFDRTGMVVTSLTVPGEGSVRTVPASLRCVSAA